MLEAECLRILFNKLKLLQQYYPKKREVMTMEFNSLPILHILVD